MSARATPITPAPWRPPFWPFHVPGRLGAWLRWTARIWLVAATLLFAAMAFRGQIPRGPELQSNEVLIQLALFGLVILGEMLAWRWQAIGASIITAGAIALGVMAAIQHSPVNSFVIALVFFVPAFLYWLDWQRTRSVRTIITLAVSLSLVLAAGGIRANQVYQAYYGPSHPESTLAKLPVTSVEWIWSGAQTESSITVNAGLAHDSDSVYLAVSGTSDLARPIRFGPVVADGQANNRVVSITADGLTPDTRYYYAIESDGVIDRSRLGHFRTVASEALSFAFAVGGCAITGSNGQVFDRIRESDPLFFLVSGDLFYENIAANDPGRYRAAYEKVLTSPAQSALYRSAPIVYVWDDHDFGPNDSDRTSPSRDAAQQVYRQIVPHVPLPAGDASGAIYQAFTIGRVRFIVTDARSEKSPASDPDTAAKTMLGAEQKQWFKRELLAARDSSALIVWVSSVPWIGVPAATSDDWSGYATERRELADFIAEHQVTNLLMLAGDAHMLAIDDGTNSDYATNGGAGFPVFHAAALDRPGSAKGGPFSEGAYAGGGQFGLVTVEDDGGATVTVSLSGRNYRGEEIVSHAFTVLAGAGSVTFPDAGR